MLASFRSLRVLVPGVLLLLVGGGCSTLISTFLMPEQRTILVREPSAIPHAAVPETAAPPTVENPVPDAMVWELSLDEAIRIALANSKVVRLLAGVTAVSSGSTIYDTAIANTAIDSERARFDPQVNVSNTFNRFESPFGLTDPTDPTGARIAGTNIDEYNLGVGLSKTTVTGGTASVDFTDRVARFQPGVFALNPEERSALTLGYTQPLLQGGGIATNVAPIVIAQIETERSFFQFKDNVQGLVRGVIEGYWNLVSARTDVWARRQQVQQGREAYERADARQRGGLGNAAEVAQSRSALANFEANLIGAEANVLTREAALRNILGLPPTEARKLVPVTPPSDQRLRVNWNELIQLAEERRPDLIELQLIIEAEQQRLVQARNQTLPRLDAVAQYRWNGLEGRTPALVQISTDPGEFTDWTLGVTFSVPLGQRAARASLRRIELILDRDRANLDQGVHSMLHTLAGNTRDLAQSYEQYVKFKEARAAARINLDQQVAEFRIGRTIFLNVLEAITTWGNAVTAEAQSLTQYNTELANLERETGTILETHGVHFYQERFASIGPLGRCAKRRWYPQSLPPTPNGNRYPTSARPAENFFNLESPLRREVPSATPTPDPRPAKP